jgi:hypothetical protein
MPLPTKLVVLVARQPRGYIPLQQIWRAARKSMVRAPTIISYVPRPVPGHAAGSDHQKLIIDVHGKMDRRFGRASRLSPAACHFFSSLHAARCIHRSGPSPPTSLYMISFIISPISCFAPIARCYFRTRGRTKFSERCCWGAHDKASEPITELPQEHRSVGRQNSSQTVSCRQTGTEALRASPGSSSASGRRGGQRPSSGHGAALLALKQARQSAPREYPEKMPPPPRATAAPVLGLRMERCQS